MLGASKRKQSLQIKIGRKMSNITPAELNTMKEKASRRLSFRMNIPQESASTNASTEGVNSPKSSGNSVDSNSTIDIHEQQVNSYRGAAMIYKEIKKSKFSLATPETELPSLNVSFPIGYNFDSSKFTIRSTERVNSPVKIDSTISGIRKTIKKIKNQNKLKRKNRSSKK